MSNFQQNGINFTIENNFQPGEKRHAVKGKITSVANDYAGYETDDSSKLINAVDIDWNGANSATLKTYYWYVGPLGRI